MQTLAVFGNPSRRRKSGKRRSAAQRAATARMLAANRSKRGGGTKRRARRRTAVAVASAPRRVSRRRSVRRSASRAARRFSSGFRSAGIVGMLKNAAITGAGAVGVDVAMGYVAPMLPASMATPVDPATGGANYGYYGVKAALAIGIGHFGKRVSPQYAPMIAGGALTVLAYQLLRPMVPASVSMGNFNPAPTMRPRLAGVNAYVSGVNAYQNVRSIAPARKGAGAANAMAMVQRRTQAA